MRPQMFWACGLHFFAFIGLDATGFVWWAASWSKQVVKERWPVGPVAAVKQYFSIIVTAIVKLVFFEVVFH